MGTTRVISYLWPAMFLARPSPDFCIAESNNRELLVILLLQGNITKMKKAQIGEVIS